MTRTKTCLRAVAALALLGAGCGTDVAGGPDAGAAADAAADAALPPDAGAADAGGDVPLDPKDESQDFPFPGADTMPLPGTDRYLTVGAGRHVPYAIHGSGNYVGTSPTIAGRALRDGGAWSKGKNFWTPAAWEQDGHLYLFYSARVDQEERKHCVGVAASDGDLESFVPQPRPLVCPTKARWAIDADVVRAPNGTVWLTWRDGQRAIGGDSALSAVKLSFSADHQVSTVGTPTVLLRSDDLAWASKYDTAGVVVIENPSAFRYEGNWYLFYSGNSWNTNYYATGVAFCGKALGDGPCRPMPEASVAYFAYAGEGTDALPKRMRLRRLPGNKRGPGAMDVYRARDGSLRVTWNYRSDEGDHSRRKSRTGVLLATGRGDTASFEVVLAEP